MTYYVITTFLGTVLYFCNKWIGSLWDNYDALVDIPPIFYMLILPIAFTLIFYKMSKGRREEITPIDSKKEEEKYDNKEKKKLRNEKINNLVNE